jgi:hypothetical protein
MRAARSLEAIGALLLLSCGGDDLTTPSSQVVGTYQATTFTATQNGISANLLALGGGLSMTLAEDGTATGHLLAPRLGENGRDVDMNLNGTWTLNGDAVRFMLPQETFLREMRFRVEPNRLVGDENFGTTRVQLVLTKAQ